MLLKREKKLFQLSCVSETKILTSNYNVQKKKCVGGWEAWMRETWVSVGERCCFFDKLSYEEIKIIEKVYISVAMAMREDEQILRRKLLNWWEIVLRG